MDLGRLWDTYHPLKEPLGTFLSTVRTFIELGIRLYLTNIYHLTFTQILFPLVPGLFMSISNQWRLLEVN
jgi:hypothetical protein